MSESCPLDEIDAYDRRGILWDKDLATDKCIEQCVMPSILGSLAVSEVRDLPEDFDPENDDSSIHYGVQWLRQRHRAGFYDYGPDDPDDQIITEQTTSVFICPSTMK